LTASQTFSQVNYGPMVTIQFSIKAKPLASAKR
jgi:hypothetical protein